MQLDRKSNTRHFSLKHFSNMRNFYKNNISIEITIIIDLKRNSFVYKEMCHIQDQDLFFV